MRVLSPFLSVSLLATSARRLHGFKILPCANLSSLAKGRGSIRSFTSVNEVEAAKVAASTDPAINPHATTFFDKIISKEIPAKIIYEDDHCLAFRDISPQGPVHFLVIPKNKQGLNKLSSATEEHIGLLGHLMFAAQKVAKQEKLDEGFRVVINNGKHGAQSVYHIHLHVIGGRQMSWPPG